MKTLQEIKEFAVASASMAIDQAEMNSLSGLAVEIASHRANILLTLKEFGMLAYEKEAIQAFDKALISAISKVL